MWQKLVIGVIGIYSAYLSMSYFSEKLYNTQFLPSDPTLPPASFTFPFLTVWLGCLLCSIAGYVISLINREPVNPISTQQRVIMGSLFAVNMVTTNAALLYISFPVQVIGRNIRFLFVVIIGAFFSRVKNTHSHLKLGKHKIFIASLITIGVILFNLAKGKRDKADKHDPQYEWIGYLLLGVSVIVDALFSDSQAYAKATFKPTSNQLFTTTNFYSFVICAAISIFFQGSFTTSIKFLINYPAALSSILWMGALQVVGQISIYYIVANFKQHIFPLIATTRKVLTIILSIFIFNHSINNYQWMAIGIVFIGMFYQFYEELRHQKHKDELKSQGKAGSDSEEEPLKTNTR